jgi:5-methylcytosine-specific restriction protein B
MSRFCGEKNTAPILDAAARWRDVALLQDGSVFTARHLWTTKGLQALDKFFIQQPDAGEGNFWGKLKGQLSQTDPEVKHLMAEMTWMMLLCPSNILASKKREQVANVWGWSGETLPDSSKAYLTDSILGGIGSAGPGFNNHRWREVEFCINFGLAFKGLPLAERKRILQDGWTFAEWLASVPGADVRQLRHMLLFLLFPDSFERIFGQTDRRAVVVAFGGKKASEAARMEPLEIDRALSEIRKKLEGEYHTSDIDFYISPVEERWKSDEALAEVITESKQEMVEGNQISELVTKFVAQARAGNNLVVRDYIDKYRDLEVRVSFGQGNFARVPWIAFLTQGQKVQKGIYPVLLLFREQNILLLCYGVSQTNPPVSSWKDVGGVTTVNALFKKKYGTTPPNYDNSYVLSEYDLNKPLPIHELAAKLDWLIDRYKAVTQSIVSTAPPAGRQDPAQAAVSFSSALRQSLVSFGAGHEDLIRSFVASIATKPFIILTGLSGSGKTQIAIRFGEWLGPDQLYVAPVRPDWTGSESLLGYEDGLRPQPKGFAAWQVPGVLEFMLQAADDPSQPYVLLLDEMNLAHVERYFADVLSGMESGEPCLPNLSKDEEGTWRLKSLHDKRIPFPRNLWVIGTVNVDETTYVFSPKVLDRANTFEFRVEGKDLQLTSGKPIKCSSGDPALVRGLLEITCDDKWQHDHPAKFRNELEEKLRQLHDVLSRYVLEFGHRVFYESLRFAALADKIGMGGLEPVLDRIVMQKVLPRLHGSRRKLEHPLLALAHFCRDLPGEVAADDKLLAIKSEQQGDAPPKLPISYAKVCRMIRSLRANQFASFTE